MFGEAGHVYVYMIYGVYHCLNVVTEKKDFPAAVLIRAVKIDGVDYKKTNGPGKLCKFLEIDRKLNGWDVTHTPKQSLMRGKPKPNYLWFEKGIKVKSSQIKKDRRIGIDYAKHCREYLWRFTLHKI
jgi:DNA-3-methyladenine glycosylase